MRQSYAIAAESLVLLETGEYSDKTTHGPFKALQDFDLKEKAKEFKSATFTPRWDGDEPEPSDFLAWLATSGLIEDVPAVQFHIGSYSGLEIE